MPCQHCCLHYVEEEVLNICTELLMALCQGQYPEIHNVVSLFLGKKSHASLFLGSAYSPILAASARLLWCIWWGKEGCSGFRVEDKNVSSITMTFLIQFSLKVVHTKVVHPPTLFMPCSSYCGAFNNLLACSHACSSGENIH